jgi:catechol 2,3-dioxygenase-like lactoylglutathione lyase family enzyme
VKQTKTYGLTHLAIAVKDLDRTLLFYQQVFEMEVMYHERSFLQLTTPGTNDILVFEKKDRLIGALGGIAHFGFRLRNPADIADITERVRKAGGRIISEGEFVPGSPYIFFKDPDGYEVEVWYEKLPV